MPARRLRVARDRGDALDGAVLALNPPVLLAYRALGLGDLLTAVPALRALAGAFPGHRRVLAGPGRFRALALATGAVDDVLDTPELGQAPLRAVDVAVNLHGSGPQSHRLLLDAAPRRLVAFARPDLGVAGPTWREREHEVARWCRLLAESGVPADPTRLDLALPPRPVPPGAQGSTVVHPGASAPARRWPADRWAEVARHERGAGRDVFVTGSAGERMLAERVAADAGLPPSAVLAGRTEDVVDLAAVVAAAGRVVSGDTGVAHLATALRTPSVVLFGPVSPLVWGPPPDRPWHVALWRPSPAGTGDLSAVTVEEVLLALERLPPRAPPPPQPAGARPSNR